MVIIIVYHYLAILQEAWEGTVHLLAARRDSCPVPVVAVGPGRPVELIAVLAVVDPGGSVVQRGSHHHPVL